ncbi:MAG: hypothetical protein AAB426_15230, partial [Myxococcota bacterium]
MTSIPYAFSSKERGFVAIVEGQRVALGPELPKDGTTLPATLRGAKLEQLSEADFEQRYPTKTIAKRLRGLGDDDGRGSTLQQPSTQGVSTPVTQLKTLAPSSETRSTSGAGVGEIAAPELALVDLKTAEGLKAIGIVADGQLRAQIALKPGIYELPDGKGGVTRVTVKEDSVATFEIEVRDGRLVPENTWLRVAPKIKSPWLTRIAGAKMREVGGDDGEVYRLKLDMRFLFIPFGKDVTQQVFG